MHFKLRHLEVFHAVMEEGSVTKAAERLNLSQPAISSALTAMEEMLGYQLFHRSKGHFTPRPEAFLLQADAELSLMAVEQFSARARLIGQGRVGLVRIGTIGAAASGVLPEVTSAFVRDNPSVEIDLQVHSSSRIAYLVGNGQLDVGLVEAPVAAASVFGVSIEVPCVCIFHESSDLARLSVVSPNDLVGLPLIGIQNGHQIERQLTEVCSQAGIELHVAVRGFYFSIVRRMVANVGGVAIVDAINGVPPLDDGVVWRPFEPKITYQMALITKTGAAMSRPASEFADRLQKALVAVAQSVKRTQV